MDEKYHRLHQIILVFFDIVCIILGALIASKIKFGGFEFMPQNLSITKFTLIFILLWGLCGQARKIYASNRLIKIGERFSRLFQTLIFHLPLFSAYLMLTKDFYSREYIMYAYLFSFIPIILFRTIFMSSLRLLRSKGLNYKKFIIVGNGQVSEDVALQMSKYPEFGYKLLGVFSDEHSDYLRDKKHGYYKDCYTFLKNEAIDEVYCTLSLKEKPKIQELIKFCELNLIRFTLVPDLEGIYGHKVNINFFESLPIITLRKEPLQVVTNRIIKRAFDIIFSLLVLLFIFPFLLLIIIPAILIESPGPVFYKQNRAGLNGKTFKIWKFRTMTVTESDSEFKQAEKGDIRITKIGNILRKTSLDEMPQFINILIGNMSVVGPRPHVAQLNEQYRLLVDKYMIRLLVKPGLTGHAQINGFRGETKTNEQMKGRIKSDIWYLENWTFTLDVRIIFQTVINILKGEENAA